MRINVTKRDIKNGRPSDCSFCPVAMAIQRHFKNDEIVDVYDTDVLVAGQYLNLPMKVRQFVRDFDNHRKVKPFNFQLYANFDEN